VRARERLAGLPIRLRHLVAAAVFIVVVLACSKSTSPTPLPTPSPVASATPSVPLRPLEAGDFNASLKAATSCCADSDESNGDEGLLTGWPFVNESTLDLYSRTGVQITEIRLGPNKPENLQASSRGFGFWREAAQFGYHASDPGPEESLNLAEQTARAAYARNIHLLIGLYDAWPLKHGLNAYGDTCEVMRHAPRDYHQRWVHTVVSRLRVYPNVTFYDGNETYDCDARRVWVNGIFDAARSAGYGGPLGSNSGLDVGDFAIIHGWRPSSAPGANMESDNRDHSVEEWLEMRRGASGTTFFWRGPMSMSEWVRLLEQP
jgi:hypothetical protein